MRGSRNLYPYRSVRDAEFEDGELRAVLGKAVRDGKVTHPGNSISNGGAAGDGSYETEST